MKKCPYCGAEIEESARFCLYCMQSLTEKEQILPHQKKKMPWVLILSAVIAALLISVTALLVGKLPSEEAPSVGDTAGSPSATEAPDTSPVDGTAGSPSITETPDTPSDTEPHTHI